jgi:Na+/melibiose symporter-like transporter
LGTLFAIWVMSDYSITEERAKEIRFELDQRNEIKKEVN